jgi:thioester reductase-like protein
MRIFITGATGFIGYLVTRLLREQQYDIHALVCPASEVAEMKIPFLWAFTGSRIKRNHVAGFLRCNQGSLDRF